MPGKVMGNPNPSYLLTKTTRKRIIKGHSYQVPVFSWYLSIYLWKEFYKITDNALILNNLTFICIIYKKKQ